MRIEEESIVYVVAKALKLDDQFLRLLQPQPVRGLVTLLATGSAVHGSAVQIVEAVPARVILAFAVAAKENAYGWQ